ncbi:MAG: hypothetical protein RR140_01110 [Clostridia bacterium]
MSLNAEEYKQKIQGFSKSTLAKMSTILFGAKTLEQVKSYHKMVMEAKSEQELMEKLKNFC